jgi:L-alanine-DL-glutamate epimerase-like enolase superfamily enzyme
MHLLHQTFYDRLWPAGYAIRDGKLHLPDTPGLGIEIKSDDPALTKIG